MTAEPRHERDDDLNRTAHNAITDQAAQLVHEADLAIRGGGMSIYDAGQWTFQALAVLREVARG